MIYSILLLVFSLWFIYNVVIWLRSMYKFRSFRGPTPLPFIGNVSSKCLVSPMRYFTFLRRNYGPISTFFVFNTPFLVVSEPSAIRQILTDTKSFPKGVGYTVGFAYIFGEGLVTSDSEKHRTDRSRFSKYFVRSNISMYMDNINTITKQMIKELEEVHPENSFITDVEHFFAPLALRIFSTFCTGKDLYVGRRDAEARLCKAASDASYMTGVSVLLRLPHLRGIFPWTKVLDRLLDEIIPEIKNIIATRRKEMADGTWNGPEDCVSQMIQDNLSDKDVVDHMVTLLCAGHDTTAFFACYMVHQLAHYPDVQEKLRKEVLDTLGDQENPTADQIKDMAYMRKVMLETLRVFTIIPTLARYCVEDFELKDLKVTIPKGTEILIPMSTVTRDETVWERPTEFDPERFEGSEMSVAKKGFFPFGYGSRVCIGNTLAQMESTVFMCHLLRRYRFEVDPKFKLKINSGISLTTTNGIRVRLTKIQN